MGCRFYLGAFQRGIQSSLVINKLHMANLMIPLKKLFFSTWLIYIVNIKQTHFKSFLKNMPKKSFQPGVFSEPGNKMLKSESSLFSNSFLSFYTFFWGYYTGRLYDYKWWISSVKIYGNGYPYNPMVHNLPYLQIAISRLYCSLFVTDLTSQMVCFI